MNKPYLMQGDCLEGMKKIPDGYFDFILTDPPYGTTACKWDSVIDLDLMWLQLKRLIKSNGVICLFSAQPFTSVLVSSNTNMFKYSWVWEKDKASNFMVAKLQVLKYHEDICIFINPKIKTLYNPQMWDAGKPSNKKGKAAKIKKESAYNTLNEHNDYTRQTNLRYPKSILKFNTCKSNDGVNGCKHPTQKPVALLEYLIKTYTNEGEKVLDFTMGSGSTGVACVNTKREFVGIEKDAEYFKIAHDRIFNP